MMWHQAASTVLLHPSHSVWVALAMQPRRAHEMVGKLQPAGAAGPAPGAAGLCCLRRLDSAWFLSTSLLQLLQVPALSSLANSLSPKLRPGTTHSGRPNAALNSCGHLLLGCIERLSRNGFSHDCIVLGERHTLLHLPLDYLGHHSTTAEVQ